MKLKKEIVIVLIIIIAISMTILPNYLNDLDELWNFNFAKNMVDGKVPYRDFNMVITPLFPIIMSVFLNVFGTELIVMRILAIILCSIIFFLIYKIMKLLTINKVLTYLSLAILYLLFFSHFRIDYNLSILFIILIVLYREIKKIKEGHEILEHNFKSDFLLGLLIGSTILLKQTVGLFVSVIFILYKLLLSSTKKDFIIALRIILTRLLGVLVPILSLIIYLISNNIWTEFLDYTVYGVSTFTNYVSYVNLFKSSNIVISILSILVPFAVIYMYIKSVLMKQTKEQDKLLFVLFVYSVSTFIFVIPIADQIHFLIGSIPTIIAIVYIVWEMYKKIIDKYNTNKMMEIIKIMKQSIEFSTYVFITCIIIISFIVNFDYIKNIANTSRLNHYKFIRLGEENIKIITEYILEMEKEGTKVYILDATAVVYMIPINKSNKDYDLFLKGNLGASGEEGQIEKLKEEHDCYILIMNENYGRNWQTPEKVREYIISSWHKTGELLYFDIYEKGETI